ncbi:MAG: hypothetical protein CL908_26880 [Deltaproteobacteria bacterium]|nr:hypothetical protein [Deltaproteobacteria bacterium]
MRMISLAVAVLGSLALAGPAALIEGGVPAIPQEIPKPGPQQAIFQNDIGTWAATMKAFNALTGAEIVSKGTETNKYGPGRMTLITGFRGRFMGKPFIGHGVLGYDDDGRLVASWTDNRSGKLRFFKGEVGADKKKRVLLGESKHAGETYKERHTVYWESRTKRRFTIETQGNDGKWLVALEITYTKRR